MGRRIDHVVFDFDGTLVDSNHIKQAAYFEVAGRVPGGAEAMTRVHGTVAGDRYDLWRAWAGEMGLGDGSDQIAAYSQAVEDAITATREMPGAADTVAALRAGGLHVYISSATPRVNLLAILQRRGWTDWFDGIYGRPETKPEILTRHILPKAGSFDHVAVVGDGGDDRASAAGAGCRFFPVGEARGAPEGGDPKVYTLPEIAEALTA